jgi:hypothetical protein
MGKANSWTPHLIGDEWEIVKGVTEPGWWALDDNFVAVLGPYDSKKACEKAIRRA